MCRKIGLQIFRQTYKLLVMMIGLRRLRKLPLVRRIYEFLGSRLVTSDDVALIDAPGGKMYLDAAYQHGASWILFLDGVYEKHETELFSGVVKEGMTVVDLGANIGYYTLLAAKLVGEKGKVFAFEPEPHNFALLVKNIKANGYDNVVPVQKAVSNRSGTTRLFLHQEDAGRHKIYDSHDSRDSIEVDVITLDSLGEDNQYPIDLIKMDIEGAEMAALVGVEYIWFALRESLFQSLFQSLNAEVGLQSV